MTLITVLPRYAKGFTSLDEPTILPTMDYKEAFEAKWPNHMHFLPYWLEADGLAEGVSVRAKKGSAHLLTQAGYTPVFGLLVLEIDYQPLIFPDPTLWGSYSTRRGWRFFAELAHPIGPEHYEAEVRRQALRWRDIELNIDRQCLDWTHIWALPHVVRDGRYFTSTITYPTTTYTPGGAPLILPPTRRTRTLGADRTQAGRTPEERITLARQWLASIPPAIAGQGGDRHTFRVAQGVVRGHWLTVETATALLSEWNERCQPPWTTERLEYKAKEASEHGKMAMGALLFNAFGLYINTQPTPPADTSTTPTPCDDLMAKPSSVKNCDGLLMDKAPSAKNDEALTPGIYINTQSGTPQNGQNGVTNDPSATTDEPLSINSPSQFFTKPPLTIKTSHPAADVALRDILSKIVSLEVDESGLSSVTDSLLARFVLAEMQAETPVTALDDVLYRRIDNAWVKVTKPEWSQIADAWEGRSPDDTRFKPITLNFARKRALRHDLCDRLDTGSDEHPDVLFWVPEGGVRLDGSIKEGIPPVGVVSLPSSWNEQAECPRFRHFLEQIVPSEANRNLIQDFVGMCHLSRGVDAHTVLCFEGPGRNGKSTLISLISKTFSPVHRTCLPPQAMEVMERRSALRRAKINIVGEISGKALADTTDFKQIVTGDLISIRNLRQDQEVICPFAGHLFATNLAPSAQDESIGFVSKWMIVYFASIIPEKERIENLGDTIWAEEAVGICRWFLEGARRAAKRGLVIPQEARDEMRIWQDLSDPVRQILAEILETQTEISLTKTLETVNLKLGALRAPLIGRERMVRYLRAQGLRLKETATKNVWVRRTQETTA